LLGVFGVGDAVTLVDTVDVEVVVHAYTVVLGITVSIDVELSVAVKFVVKAVG
jgi:hypothetical protein